jgi:thioredoxin:protein disulfide reductase
LIIAVFLGVFLPQRVQQHKLNRSLGVIMGVLGMVLMIGSITMPNVMSKWVHAGTSVTRQSFIVVPDVMSLNKQLSLAQAQHQPVILDYYADWCASCVAMDRHVFSHPAVQHQLKHYVLLRADLSANTMNDEQLLKTYDVIAPPTVIFFDSTGHELNSQRIVGEVDAKEFLARLNLIESQS